MSSTRRKAAEPRTPGSLDSLLARFAEESYWLARYVERTENLARLLDVTESFGRHSDDGAEWASILALFSDMDAFKKRYKTVDARSVIRFYTLDKDNPNSIIASVRYARNNARTLRHLISVEMWMQINVFYNRLESMRARDVVQPRLSAFCKVVKDDCQAFLGCALNTIYRDQVWHFYRFGRLVERCDQTTRLVDIKTGPLLNTKASIAEAIDLSQWHRLLRAASAYHGYLRRYPRDMTPSTVAGFILFDPGFPRSITFCCSEMRDVLDQMRGFIDEKQHANVLRQLKKLDKMSVAPVEKIMETGMHDYLDAVQLELIGLHQRLATGFFPAVA